MTRLSLHQRLALLALALGVLVVFARPRTGGAAIVRTQELERLVQLTSDHVKPRDLADWIVAGRNDYRLIDLRSEAEYAAYHIPTAENIPLARLSTAPLARNEKLVLYSEGGIHAAQAWLLLRAEGYVACYSLLNGLEGWKDEVLNPIAPSDSTPDALAAFARAAEVARHFGGAPRRAGSGALAVASTPLPATPPAAVAPPPAMPPAASGGAPKKKEGC
ncbi:MAG: rhodanese-like domain-containing protein [Candidatus Eisenbacteria bacterium]